MKGILLTLSAVAAYFYITQRRRMRVHAPMIVTAILMISLATAKIAVDGRNVIVAFFNYETRAERIAYFSDVSEPLVAVKHAIIVCLLFIGNTFMVSLNVEIIIVRRILISSADVSLLPHSEQADAVGFCTPFSHSG